MSVSWEIEVKTKSLKKQLTFICNNLVQKSKKGHFLFIPNFKDIKNEFVGTLIKKRRKNTCWNKFLKGAYTKSIESNFTHKLFPLPSGIIVRCGYHMDPICNLCDFDLNHIQSINGLRDISGVGYECSSRCTYISDSFNIYRLNEKFEIELSLELNAVVTYMNIHEKMIYIHFYRTHELHMYDLDFQYCGKILLHLPTNPSKVCVQKMIISECGKIIYSFNNRNIIIIMDMKTKTTKTIYSKQANVKCFILMNDKFAVIGTPHKRCNQLPQMVFRDFNGKLLRKFNLTKHYRDLVLSENHLFAIDEKNIQRF